ncbi:MAG: glycerophosphodiester phosphodiesterase family protein [Bacteroidetes bacterium]|nr:glycerophosphodiester phosphodiesterase family protein [Bacteroidota bacterium]
MKAKFYLQLLVIITLLAAGCGKDTSNNPVETAVMFLGNKGAGSNYYNHKHIENTISSFQEAIATDLEGVAADIQMSLDGTLWMYSNTDLSNSCNKAHNCIINLHDADIEKRIICDSLKKDRVYKLSELIDIWNANTKGFILSLNLLSSKDIPSDSFDLYGGDESYMIKLSGSLIKLLTGNKHPASVIVETDNRTLKDRLSAKVIGVSYCLSSSEDFNTRIANCLAWGFNGFSVWTGTKNLSKDAIQSAKSQGLFVQVFIPSAEETLRDALNLNPTYILTNKVDAKAVLNVK